MAMELKEKGFYIFLFTKNILILNALSDCPSLLNKKREKKKKMRACHFKA